jgi:gluconate 5-dehydrogenase
MYPEKAKTMEVNLKDFHAVITGGSSGLGFEMARALASRGATVAIAARPGEKLSGACAALSAEGFDVHALPMDVREESSVNSAAAWVEEKWGRLDMLVNNAGIGMSAADAGFATEPLAFWKIPPDAFYDIVETNFIGYFLAARAFAPIMIRRGGGRLVNVSTSIPTMTARGQLPYGPARAGAEAMSKIMAGQLKDFGVTVNVILPGGATDTGFIPEQLREVFKSRGLLKPDILNEVILFLASPKAKDIHDERIIGKEFPQWLKDKGF